MEVTPSGIVTIFSAEQSWNAHPPIDWTVVGSSIPVSAVQYQNVLPPIDVMDVSLRLISVRARHPANVFEEIRVSVDGSITVLSVVLLFVLMDDVYTNSAELLYEPPEDGASSVI